MAILPANRVISALRRGTAGRIWRPATTGIPPIPAAFSEAAILAVYPPEQVGAQWYFSWLSVAPPGTWYQLYVDQQLVWAGQSTSALVPVPPGVQRINIGTVGAANAWVSYVASLPAAPDRFAMLTWEGGLFESPSLAGFYVYQSEPPGGSVDYTTPAATIASAPSGIATGGYGMGDFGGGGFGASSGTFTWTSAALTSGVWTFAVVPFDSFGNSGPTRVVELGIEVPPLEPAPFSDGSKLHYTYASDIITLNWNASPG